MEVEGMNVKKLIAIFLLILTGCSQQRDTKPEKPVRVITICSGCGSEWESLGPGDVEPITKCPNCPMSIEEFEALKEQVRHRLEEERKAKEVENE